MNLRAGSSSGKADTLPVKRPNAVNVVNVVNVVRVSSIMGWYVVKML